MDEWEEALTAFLLADAGLAAVVAKRITWDERQQGASLPAIVLQVISGAPEASDEGRAGIESHRVQIDCWASTSLAAKTAARAVNAALEAVEMTSGDTVFEAVFLDAERDFSERGQGGRDLYRRSLDYIFWHKQAS